MTLKYLNFTIAQSVINTFTESSHADRGTINKKHIKRDFFYQRCVSVPLGGLWGSGQKVKNHFLQNIVILHIKLKGIIKAA